MSKPQERSTGEHAAELAREASAGEAARSERLRQVWRPVTNLTRQPSRCVALVRSSVGPQERCYATATDDVPGVARPDPMPQTHVQLDRGLVRAADDLAAARSLRDVHSVLCARARAIVGADGIAVVLREGDNCNYAAEDAIEILWQGVRRPLDTCISGWAMLNNETAVVPDIAFDPRVSVAAYRTTSMRSLVMVPIGSPEAVAALGAYWCAAIIPDDATVYRLEMLAHHAAAALARISIESGADQSGVPG